MNRQNKNFVQAILNLIRKEVYCLILTSIFKEPIEQFLVKTTLEILQKVKWVARELMCGRMEKPIEENGNKINYMEKVSFIGLIKLIFRANMSTMNVQDRD